MEANSFTRRGDASSPIWNDSDIITNNRVLLVLNTRAYSTANGSGVIIRAKDMATNETRSYFAVNAPVEPICVLKSEGKSVYFFYPALPEHKEPEEPEEAEESDEEILAKAKAAKAKK